MILERLIVRLDGKIDGFEAALSSAESRVVSFGGRLQKIGGRMTVGITAPLTVLAGLSVRVASNMDSLRRGLEAVGGGSAEAEKQLVRLEDVAKLPGLGFREAIEGSVRLQAVGFSAEFAERALRAFGNAIATTGGGKAELNRLTVQLGQLGAKGKVLAQDLRPIIEAAPLVGRALQEAFGTVDAEEIQKLGLTTEEFLDRLLTQLEKMPQVSRSARTSFEDLSDSAERASAAVGNTLLPTLARLSDMASVLLDRIADAPPTVLRFGIVVGGAVAALGPLALSLGTVVKLLPVIKVGLAALTGPIGVVTLAVTALAGAWLDAATKAERARTAQRQAVQEWQASLPTLSADQLEAQAQEALRKRNIAMRNLQRERERIETATNRRLRAQAEERAAHFEREVNHYQSIYVQLLAQQRRNAQTTEEQTTAVVAFGRALDDTADTISRLLERQEKLRESIAETRFEQAFVTTAEEAKKLNDELARMQAELAKVEASLQRIARSRLGGLPDVTPGVQTSVPLTPVGGTVRLSRAEQERFRRLNRLPDPVPDWRADVIEATEEAAAATEQMRVAVVNNFGAMVEAAIWGGQQMEVSIVRGITNIVANLPGVGGLAGAIIGTVGGIVGSLFGRRREPQPVRVPEMPKAVKELEKINASLRNVPLEWVNLMKHQLIRTLSPASATPPPPRRARPQEPTYRIDQVNIHAAPGDQPEQLWEKFKTGMKRAASGGDPDARELLGAT